MISETAIGYAPPSSPAVLIEDRYQNLRDHVAAHELGHTYGLCDEYNSTIWNNQNTIFGGFSDLCPNGDINEDEVLDSECEPFGCPTFTLQSLSGAASDDTDLSNLMGNADATSAWISKESYLSLLGQFNHSTPIYVQSRAVISGQVNGSSSVITFDNFYSLGAGLAENPTDHTTGNYSLSVLNGSNVIYSINFSVSFLDIFFGGNTTERSDSAFIFTVPLNDSASSIVVKYNGVVKDTRNISSNAPLATLISPQGNQTYSNREIMVNWTALDIDGENLSYAVLFSSDNGQTYSTMVFDHNKTWFNLSSNDLEDSNQYLVKVLVTDGVLTGSAVMNSTFEIDNDLQIKSLDVVYLNDTQRVFRILLNNTLNQNISNITWEFDSGENTLASSYNLTLQSSEEVLFFIYHNYSISGDYSVSFKARSGIFKEFENRSIFV